MAVLLGIPILLVAVILQSSIISQISLLQGQADLVLLVFVSWAAHERVKTTWEWSIMAGLFLGYVTGIAFWIPLMIYLSLAGISWFFKQRVMQVPIVTLLFLAFTGTMINHLAAYLYLILSGTTIAFGEAFNRIILPSLLLNLLLAIPINGIMSELAEWLYPSELDI